MFYYIAIDPTIMTMIIYLMQLISMFRGYYPYDYVSHLKIDFRGPTEDIRAKLLNKETEYA